MTSKNFYEKYSCLPKDICDELHAQLDEIRRLEEIERKTWTWCGTLKMEEYQAIMKRIKDALSGNIVAIDQLGRYCWKGNSNVTLAFHLFEFASLQGHEPSFVMLGQCFAKGIGTPRNIRQAIFWFERSIRYCDVNTLVFLGSCYRDGEGVLKDLQKSIHYFVAAADAGHRDMFNLYSFAANKGNAQAQYKLGKLYLDGIVVPLDIGAGFYWLQESAKQNNVHAQCSLGVIQLRGLFGVEINPLIAFQWFRLASEQGDDDATKYLAECFLLGKGTEKNIDEVIRIWKKFAQERDVERQDRTGLEHIFGDKYCQYELGILYFDATLSEHYNPKEAMKWLRLSAQQDHVDAQVELGIRLLKGEGAKQNLKEARYFLHKAAKQNHEVAQFYLAEIYAEGNGVAINWKEAFKWYQKSAETGYAPAQQVIANGYSHGIGTTKNEKLGLDIETSSNSQIQNQQQYFEKRFEKSLNQIFCNVKSPLPDVISPRESLDNSLPIFENNKQEHSILSEQIIFREQEMDIESEDAEYNGLPDWVKIWNVNFYVINKDYYHLIDIATRENTSIDRILEHRFFSYPNVFLDHFGGRIPERLSSDSVWIAAIVVGNEQDIKTIFSQIDDYMKQSGAANGYEDLDYLPFSNQPYVGYVESLNKETKYRYRLTNHYLQRLTAQTVLH
jgi:TPR repeat protein